MIVKLNELKNNVQGIYKLNYPNGKIYIGQSNDIKRRMYEHNNINRLKNHFNSPCDLAIQKYGRFEEVEILELVEDCSLLNEKEQYWISYYHSNDKAIGYNLTTGGTSLKGEHHPNSKLTNEEILDIRKRRFKGERKKEVFKLYEDKITFGGFERIWLGRTSSHIGKEFIIPANEISRQEYSSIANSGENNGMAKLNKEKVLKIREMYDNGKTVTEISQIFTEVNKKSIRRVCKRETWKNI
jgi:group I intron endonuclease